MRKWSRSILRHSLAEEPAKRVKIKLQQCSFLLVLGFGRDRISLPHIIMTTGTDGSEQIHAALLHYLKRLGYTQTEQALRDEARSFGVDALAFEMQVQDEASLSASVLFGMKKTERGFSKASTFEGHEREYMKLRQWIHGSLDLFREELLPCLFPIFAHLAIDLMIRASREDCTTTLGSVLDVRFLALGNEDHCLAHGDDLASLANITEPAHLKECSVSSTFLSSRYHINLSASSFQMFMSFLEDNGLLAVLRIVNQFLNIRGATLCNVLSLPVPNHRLWLPDRRPGWLGCTWCEQLG